jgi:ribulose-5-phosphate 4-epimerase/fuculose-1-phosphate aldolase
MIEEGYTKYQCHWINKSSIFPEEVEELNCWRNKLYRLNLIGSYDNGIGFGNISIRDDRANRFIISGTQTGNIPLLTERHYTKITDFDWQKNCVTCVGLIAASSETLTHGVIYLANLEVNAVIHVHHPKLWKQLINKLPTTNKNCGYGTPEMAIEMLKLCQVNDVKQQKIIIMGGHEEGIITFGSSLNEAGNILLNYYDRLEKYT